MSTNEQTERSRWHFALTVVLVGWMAAVAFGAFNGWFQGYAPMVVPGMVLFTIALPTALYFILPGLRRTMRGFGLRALTLFHVWRVGAGLLFLWYGAQGVLPAQFVTNAGWGDLLAGIFAGLVVILPFRRSFYAAVHVFGLADLILAVGTGATLTLMGVPEMNNIAAFPVALIPLVGVGVSAFTHIVAFDLLLRPKVREDEKEAVSLAT